MISQLPRTPAEHAGISHEVPRWYVLTSIDPHGGLGALGLAAELEHREVASLGALADGQHLRHIRVCLGHMRQVRVDVCKQKNVMLANLSTA